MIECVVELAYELVLDRPADEGGAEYWTAQQLPTEQLLRHLAASTEGRAVLWSSRPEALPPLADAIDIACDRRLTAEQIVREAAAEFGVGATIMLDIAVCESGSTVRGDYASIDPNAKNPNGSASGLFQHLARYWPARAKAVGNPGASVFDARTNARAAAWMLSTQGTAPWAASKGCWG